MPERSPGAAPEPERIPLIRQREIEARVLAPLVRALIAELGEPRALALLRETISGLAREGGAALAESIGQTSLTAFATCLERWSEGGALEIEVLENSPERLDFDVKRCRYAEMYQALGLGDLGSSLSCVRDFALVEGFSPRIRLTRTQTIMEGAPCCDFRFRALPGSGPSGTE